MLGKQTPRNTAGHHGKQLVSLVFYVQIVRRCRGKARPSAALNKSSQAAQRWPAPISTGTCQGKALARCSPQTGHTNNIGEAVNDSCQGSGNAWTLRAEGTATGEAALSRAAQGTVLQAELEPQMTPSLVFSQSTELLHQGTAGGAVPGFSSHGSRGWDPRSLQTAGCLRPLGRREALTGPRSRHGRGAAKHLRGAGRCSTLEGG